MFDTVSAAAIARPRSLPSGDVIELRLDLSDAGELRLQFFHQVIDLPLQGCDLANVIDAGCSSFSLCPRRTGWSCWSPQTPRTCASTTFDTSLGRRFVLRSLTLCHGRPSRWT